MDSASKENPAAPMSEAHWRELVDQIGGDVGSTLNSALNRVIALTTTGKIGRTDLRELRGELEHARRVGMVGQQLARFGSGAIQQSSERLNLTRMIREALINRAPEAVARGFEIHQALRPIEVVTDATLLYALLNALADWSLEHARGDIEYRLELKPWPPNARLTCHFTHTPPDVAASSGRSEQDVAVMLNSIAWRLVQQIAWNLNLELDRKDTTQASTLTLEFPKTVNDQIEGVSAIEIDHDFGASDNSKPLAGTHILVMAQRRDLRSEIRDAIRPMSLLVDFVASVEEAENFLREAAPHALVFESGLTGERFDRLRSAIEAKLPDFVFIEITEEGADFQLSGSGTRRSALVGRDVIHESLPSALIFELSKTL